MIKTNPNSRFVLKSMLQIRDSRDIILQTEKTDSVFSESKDAVYLCEVVTTRDYHERTLDDLVAENI